jgi:uncharacterized membrane protein YfcA
MDVNLLTLTLILLVGGVVAGLIGALTGLGGGVIIVPLLTIVCQVDMRYAIGAALVSVIATSSGSAAAYVKEGWSNIRVGMFLEVATTLGAVSGAFVAIWLRPDLLAVIFGLVLLISAWLSFRPKREESNSQHPDSIATYLKMNGTYPTESGMQSYYPQHVPLGWCVMYIAGVLSGLLGIGSGALKVLAMDQVMGLPFKVSTTTSNFMIGVTAAASAGIYLSRGYIDPGLAMPIVIGVLLGAAIGTRVLAHAKVNVLRLIFSVVIVLLALQMIYGGLTGTI